MPKQRTSISDSDVESGAVINGNDEEVKSLVQRASQPPSNSNGGISISRQATNNDDKPPSSSSSSGSGITATGLKVLILLAVQNCSKNLLLRYVMKERPQFLVSAAVIAVETTKLTLSTLYILLVDRQSLYSIYVFMKEDVRNLLLLSVPAAAYNLQSSLEYVALANLDAAMFSVLVQTKLCMTAICAFLVLRKKLKRIQIISLVLLTAGVMLCNLTRVATGSRSSTSNSSSSQEQEQQQDAAVLDASTIKGIMATLGIATSSGFASVYTEKVIKAQRHGSGNNVTSSSSSSTTRGGQQQKKYSLAYMQVQLATASLIIMGCFAIVKDYDAIITNGLWQNFTWKAFVTVLNSATGGLIVAAVLKFSDSVLKGYATACSVVMTGILSMLLFGTDLNIVYFLGIINVVIAVLLYNGNKDDLDKFVC